MSITNNVKVIKNTIKNTIRIIAVTKNRSADNVREVVEAGITDIGENRLQEAKNKLQGLPESITKHFIGRLQANKIREIVRLFDVIQSVDNLKIAERINSECKKINKIMPVLIQINTSDEPQKGGASPDNAIALIHEISKLPNIKIQGLMTVAINSDNQNDIKSCFKALKRLSDTMVQQNIPNAEMRWLSMGMSEDYEMAIEEGANMIRIGGDIFQE